MKSPLPASLFTMLISVILVVSCVSKPAAPVAAAAAPPVTEAPAKVAKQRSVVTKVPVLAKESHFYADGLLDSYDLYKLDAAKKDLVEKDSFDVSRPEAVLRLVPEYKDGLLSAESVYESDGKLRSRRELSYDASGLLVQERSLDAKGKQQSASTYSYDAKGRKAEWRALDGSGAVKASSAYIYGADGLARIEMKDSGGAATGSMKLEYKGGKLAKRSYFGADGALQKYEVYSYDGAQPSSIEYRRSDGGLVSKTAYSYGSLGEVVKAVEYSASGAPGASTTYEYVVREDSSTETYYE
jgi:hypothetical protein